MLYKRSDIEKTEKRSLAPYACKAFKSKGRDHPETESDYRTSFQRDIDRIVHSKAFRRLEYKTQVFVNYEGDHYRTRLTHTFEVSRVAGSIARSLGLNQDLVEAISLAHDLGHTPFGHAGEEILNELTKSIGGFEHNRQSLRVVEKLEIRYPEFNGLNLTWETREGLLKHCSIYDQPEIDRFEPGKKVSLEGQVVNIADEIAYSCHDLEDGLRSGILVLKDLDCLALWQIVRENIKNENLDEHMLRYQTVRILKDLLITDVILESERQLQSLKILDPEDPRNLSFPIIEFSSSFRIMIKELSRKLLDNFYFHHRLVRMTTKAKWILKNLFHLYAESPKLLPEKIQALLNHSEQDLRVICDYVAGMTDRFTVDEYRKLADPSTGFDF